MKRKVNKMAVFTVVAALGAAAGFHIGVSGVG